MPPCRSASSSARTATSSAKGSGRCSRERRSSSVVAECDDADALLRAIEERRPDVVLTDIRMPPTQTDEGIRLAAELRATHPGSASSC